MGIRHSRGDFVPAKPPSRVHSRDPYAPLRSRGSLAWLARCVAVNAVVLMVFGASPRLTAAQSNPRIAARDQISVTVVGVKEFTNKYPVAVDGTIEFPEIGRVKVSGLTAMEAAALLAERLRARQILNNPQVTIEFEQTPTRKVTVNGLVRTQGEISYAGELTVLGAIVRAGGRLPEAADDVLIVRTEQARAGQTEPSEVTFTVNARELESGVLAKNMLLQDGDKLFVRKAQAVTVTGYVRNVGAYNIESGMNVEQVLALAGGVDPVRGSDRRIEITRQEKGKTITIKDVKKTDLVKPGDIIKVGRRIM